MIATPIPLTPPRLRAARFRSRVSAPPAHTVPVPAFPHVAALRAARSRIRKHARARSRTPRRTRTRFRAVTSRRPHRTRSPR